MCCVLLFVCFFLSWRRIHFKAFRSLLSLVLLVFLVIFGCTKNIFDFSLSGSYSKKIDSLLSALKNGCTTNHTDTVPIKRRGRKIIFQLFVINNKSVHWGCLLVCLCELRLGLLCFRYWTNNFFHFSFAFSSICVFQAK